MLEGVGEVRRDHEAAERRRAERVERDGDGFARGVLGRRVQREQRVAIVLGLRRGGGGA